MRVMDLDKYKRVDSRGNFWFDLRGANLRGANLRGEYIEDAILTGADLTGANLTRANLRDCLLYTSPSPRDS